MLQKIFGQYSSQDEVVLRTDPAGGTLWRRPKLGDIPLDDPIRGGKRDILSVWVLTHTEGGKK